MRGFKEVEWTAARYDIVVPGNVAKFAQNTELLRYLLGTGDRVLVEAKLRGSHLGYRSCR